MHRVRGWSDVARVAGEARQELLAEGKPVFIIADNYQMVGEISFYLPEAQAAVTKEPLVFYQTSPIPVNQFYFWPGYQDRKGQNAIFVRELDRDRTDDPPVPPELQRQFESVTTHGRSQRALSWPGAVAAPNLRLPRLAVIGLDTTKTFALRDYDLAATVTCGQAFRWQSHDRAGPGVSELTGSASTRTTGSSPPRPPHPVADWHWLAHYLQSDVDWSEVVRTFPDDEPMRAAVAACRGLRLLRQDPWECLASFILSSTKQIVQIRQIIALLCERYGEPLAVAPACPPAFAFPSPARLARATEAELRACKMGFRAPYLLATAGLIAGGQFDLARVHGCRWKSPAPS